MFRFNIFLAYFYIFIFFHGSKEVALNIICVQIFGTPCRCCENSSELRHVWIFSERTGPPVSPCAPVRTRSLLLAALEHICLICTGHLVSSKVVSGARSKARCPGLLMSWTVWTDLNIMSSNNSLPLVIMNSLRPGSNPQKRVHYSIINPLANKLPPPDLMWIFNASLYTV